MPDEHRSATRIGRRVCALGCIAVLSAPATLIAQYPLVPSAVLDASKLTRDVKLGGYVSVRDTRRNDSLVFIVNRARLTVSVAPRPGVALRIQGDLASVGRLQSDSGVPAFALTDAFVQLGVPDSLSLLARHSAMLLVGQFRTPFSLEYLTPFSLLQTANRSLAVDRLSPRRDIGVQALGELAPRVTVSAALVNGGGANTTRNPDGRELALARVVVRPVPTLAIGAKIANEGGDHLHGYDARWLWRGVTVEGEALSRRHPLGTLALPDRRFDGSGGYVLGSIRALDWLQPVAKWERYRENGAALTSATWTTYGVNFLSHDQALRAQLDWIRKHEHPVDGHDDELLVQFIAIF